jgi:hypothetical protein
MLRARTTISQYHDYILATGRHMSRFTSTTLYIFYTLSTFNACPSFCLSRRIMDWTWDLGSDGNRAWTGQDGTQDQRAAFTTHQACIFTQRSAHDERQLKGWIWEVQYVTTGRIPQPSLAGRRQIQSDLHDQTHSAVMYVSFGVGGRCPLPVASRRANVRVRLSHRVCPRL